MITWLKKAILKKLLTGILTCVVFSGFVLFPIFPIFSENTLAHWWIPSAHANNAAEAVVSTIKDLLERTGIYNPPQKATAPTGRGRGGAGRGPICILPENAQNSTSLQALVSFPVVNEQVNSQEKQQVDIDTEAEFVGGLTISERPTFWFYVPYVASSKTSQRREHIAQFVLLDEVDHPVWHELILPELFYRPRLIEYSLPYSLETGKVYKWYFSVICDAEKLSRNPVVSGWVQRIEPTDELITKLEETPGFEQYLVYAKNGIWFETINSLVNIRRQFPNIKRDEWAILLEHFNISDTNQFDLSEFATASFEREEVKGNQLPARM